MLQSLRLGLSLRAARPLTSFVMSAARENRRSSGKISGACVARREHFLVIWLL